MRESKDNWYKNYNTGELVEMIKQKPIGGNMTNFATIELFDESGKKVEECVSENIVNNALNNYAYKTFIIDTLLSKYSLVMNGLTNFSVFGNIVLTDYTGAEDATLRRMQGNIKGWANKYNTYVGADVLRGTINQSESSFTPEGALKFVFDFPTNACNGTFRSIWWTPSLTSVSITTSPFRPYCMTNISNQSLGTGATSFHYRFCVVDNKIIYIGGTTKIYSAVRSIVEDDGLFKATSTQEKDVILDDNAPRGIDFDGTYYWVYGTQNGKFYKYDASWNLITSWACAAATYMTSNYYTFCCHGGKIYTYNHVNATTWNLYQWSTTGTLENTYNLYSASYATFTDGRATDAIITSDGTSIYLMGFLNDYNTKVLEVTGSGGLVQEYTIDHPNSVIYTHYNMAFDDYKNVYIFQPNSLTAINEYFPMFSPVAQNLLPAPITKTNANTMKISYTFNLDLSGLY
jgi:hypothetical protein